MKSWRGGRYHLPVQPTYPRIGFQDDEGGLRVVIVEEGPVVEVAAGKDAMGHPVWRRVTLEDPATIRLRKIEGWKDLCAAAGLQPAQWRRLYEAARRTNGDPLMIHYDAWDNPWAYEYVMVAWLERNNRTARARDLEGAVRKTGLRRRRAA